MNSLWHKASGLKQVMLLRAAALVRRERDRVLSGLSDAASAAKDRQFADLRENWLRTHEAFQLSQEILARKDIELAQKNAQIAQKDTQISQKDAEFADFRNKWIEAYEALEYGRKLLAEKDAQLAQSQVQLDKLREQVAILETETVITRRRTSATLDSESV
jgi:chromosome segregation ATPase